MAILNGFLPLIDKTTAYPDCVSLQQVLVAATCASTRSARNPRNTWSFVDREHWISVLSTCKEYQANYGPFDSVLRIEGPKCLVPFSFLSIRLDLREGFNSTNDIKTQGPKCLVPLRALVRRLLSYVES